MLKTTPKILLVDDDPLVLQSLALALGPDFQTFTARSAFEAEEALKAYSPDVVILDLQLGQESGFEILKNWKLRFPDMPVIVCSGQTDVRMAVDCLRAGAAEYLAKPARKDDVLFVVQRVLEKMHWKAKAEKLPSLLFPLPTDFIGESAAIQDLKLKMSALQGQPHINVLILGESGTGKEVVARFLHQQERQKDRPFIVANMPAIPNNLMEGELFGVEKGAFTDAKNSRPGKFELADGGDIFLDEIGDLPMETQAKILRTLQERQIQRLGAQKPKQVAFRVIAATNRDLAEMASKGQFREDLLYRLSDWVIHLPPLRERKEDILPLTEHFLQKYSRRKKVTLSESAIRTLLDYSWPGNIRQLESVIKRSLVLNTTGVIESIDISDPLRPRTSSSLNSIGGDYATQLLVYERKILEEALQQCGGNRTLAMEKLGLSRATFYRRISDVGLGGIAE